ncbi:putative adhesin [Mongoliibacter ruber]|uniref:Putative adhesin n=2 Tax=Mongoliibacter ruber TaxID=1750599 RepID=A0A2T0WBH5_9BACT|nr:putative adhesin [Mongoliibacter ruber]
MAFRRSFSFSNMKRVNAIAFLVFSIFLFGACAESDLETVAEIQEDFSGINVIEVDSEFLDVTYVGSSGQQLVNMNASLRSNSKRRNELVYQVIENKLKISVNTKGGIRSLRSEGSIVLTGPRNIKLEMQSGSGNLEVSNVTGTELKLEAGSGKIITKNINSPVIILNGASGNVFAEDLSGVVFANISSGQMELKRIDGNVNVQGASGQIKVMSVNGQVKANISFGNLELSEVKSLGRMEISSGKLFATATGLGSETSLKASSGEIYIQTPSNLSQFNFNITTGSGTARVGESVASGTLNINNGSSFTIRGEVNSGKIEIVN